MSASASKVSRVNRFVWQSSLLWSSFAYGCGQATDQTARSAPEPAEEQLSQLVGPESTLQSVTTVTDASGEFAYMHGLIKQPGKLSRKVAIDGQGNVLSMAAARAKELQRHRAQFGRLGFTAARRLRNGDPAERQRYTLWLSEEGRRDTQLRDAIDTVDPRANVDNSAGLGVLCCFRVAPRHQRGLRLHSPGGDQRAQTDGHSRT